MQKTASGPSGMALRASRHIAIAPLLVVLAMPLISLASETPYEAGLQCIESLLGMDQRAAIERLHDALPTTARAAATAVGEIYCESSPLDLKTRELVTVAVIASLGHAEPQLRLHVRGAVNAGATRDELLATIDQLHPYVGIPVALNAATIVRNELDSLPAAPGP